MDDTVKQSVLSVVRTALAAVGAWLAARGWVDSATANQIVGAIMVAVPLVWGVWDKYRSEAATKVREATALNVGIMVSNQDPNQQTPLVPVQDAPKVIAAAKGAV